MAFCSSWQSSCASLQFTSFTSDTEHFGHSKTPTPALHQSLTLRPPLSLWLPSVKWSSPPVTKPSMICDRLGHASVKLMMKLQSQSQCSTHDKVFQCRTNQTVTIDLLIFIVAVSLTCFHDEIKTGRCIRTSLKAVWKLDLWMHRIIRFETFSANDGKHSACSCGLLPVPTFFRTLAGWVHLWVHLWSS